MTGWDARQHELDVTKNQAMYPVFQRTLQTNATKAIVLKQETTGCTSRETWGRIIEYFLNVPTLLSKQLLFLKTKLFRCTVSQCLHVKRAKKMSVRLP